MANTRLLLAHGDNPDLLYEVYATDVSRGAEDAGRLVLTDKDGKIDPTFNPELSGRAYNVAGLKTNLGGIVWSKTKITQLVNWSGYASLLGDPIIDGVGSLVIPKNFFIPGRGVRIKLGGKYSIRSTGYYYLALYLNALRVHLSKVTYPTNGLVAVSEANQKAWAAEVSLVCTEPRVVTASSDIFYEVGSSQVPNTRYITNKGEMFTIDSEIAHTMDLKCWTPTAYASDSVTVYPPATVEVFG